MGSNDVGFAAIGIGAWHARSKLMQSGYTGTFGYAAALALMYSAKRTAELAPGVGKTTDIALIFRNKIERLSPETFQNLTSLYEEYEPKAENLGLEYIGKLHSAIFKIDEQKAHENVERLTGKDAQIDGKTDTKIAETPQQDEVEKQQGDEQK